jgi:hypothetical protein
MVKSMKKVCITTLTLFVITSFFLLPSGSISALSMNPAREYDLQIIPDGIGGVYIAWALEWHSGSIQIQHLNESGLPLWKEPAILPGDTDKFQITQDGLGGIIVTHEIDLNSPRLNGVHELRVQRIDADGNFKWTSQGVLLLQKDIINSARLLKELDILSDHTGGAYIIWKPYTETGIMAQRIGSDGGKIWGEGGIEITSSYHKLGPVCIEDNEGGFIITWVQQQKNDSIMFMQRYNREGLKQWNNNGIVIEENYNSINVISDGENGAYIALANIQNASLMRINSSGEMTWGRQQIASIKGHISDVCMLRDTSSGNLNLCWAETDGSYVDTYYHEFYIFAQYYTPKGVPVWGMGPKQAAKSTGTEPILQITGDGTSGTYLIWETVKNDKYYVTAQRLDQAGQTLWGKNGKNVKRLYRMVRDFTMYPDTNGIMLFTQEGGYSQPNLYVHFINDSGDIKEAETAFYPAGQLKITEDYVMDMRLFGIYNVEWWELVLPVVIILIGGGAILAALGPTAIWRRINNRKKLFVRGAIQK